MKKSISFFAIVILTISLKSQETYEPGVILVQVRQPDVVSIQGDHVTNGSTQLQTVFQQNSITGSRKLRHVDDGTNGWYRLEYSLDAPLAEIQAALKNCPDIKHATFNNYGILAETPNDPLWSDQWALRTMDMPLSWSVTKADNTILVGVMDSGLDYTHEDLVDNVWQNLEEDADGDGRTLEWNGSTWVLDPGDMDGDDDDNNGYIDDLIGWNCNDDNNDPQESTLSHGTRVAGVIGAMTSNNTGIAGIAGGWQNQTSVRNDNDALKRVISNPRMG